MVPSESSLLEAAIKYAEMGWKVHPLHPASKMPHSNHGLHDATSDVERIRKWWTKFPEDNVAIAMDVGLYVIDVDGPVGMDSLNTLVQEYGPLPETLMAQTGKGVHYFFTYLGERMGNTTSRLAKGIDTRGSGGYCVVAPSVHPDGRRYRWINPEVSLAPLPSWVVDKLKKVTWLPPKDPNPFNTNIHPYVKKAWENVKEELFKNSAEGSRNDALNHAAFLMGGWVGAGEISRSEVEQRLTVIAAGIGLGDLEIRKTIKSGIDSGMNYPLSIPPQKTFAHENNHQAQARVSEGTINIARGSTFGRRKVEFFWNKRIPIGKLTILAGRGGTGKSFITLALGAHITSGVNLLDVEGGVLDGEVLYCSYEDDVEDTIGPRADYLGVNMDRCHFIEGVTTEHGKRPFGPQDVSRIIDYLKQCPEIKLIVIDPLGSFMGAGTNASAENETRAVLQTLVDAAQEVGAAVVVVAHLRKDDVVGGVDDVAMKISGSQGISAISRSVLMVERDENGLRWIKHVKHNLSAPAPDISYDFDDNGFKWNSVKRNAKDQGRWLRITLEAAGGTLTLTELVKKAEFYGRTEEDVQAGGRELKLTPYRDEENNEWVWSI